MADEQPDVMPMLAYEDGHAAMDWLVEAFGFQEELRIEGPDGSLAHGELIAGRGRVSLATIHNYESPKRLRENYDRARVWSAVPWIIDGVLVYVDDVDQHYAQAKRAGATILSEPEDGEPARRYRAEDPEGHRWMFMQRSV
jgi:uncharacterized glyoxalase superfamily protein PhnB